MATEERVVSAAELAPHAFGASGAKRAPARVEENVEYDLGHLMAYARDPVDPVRYEKRREAHLQRLATESTQGLVRELFSMPVGRSEHGPLVQLPDAKLRLPRHRRLPADKVETRWERFARLKGIKKTKRDKMVWDDSVKEWRPRYGYKRVGSDDVSSWLVEVKKGDDPFADPFEKRELEKKERVLRNELNRVANAQRATKSRGGLVAPAIPMAVDPKRSKKKPGRSVDSLGVRAGIAPIGMEEGKVDGLTDNARRARSTPGARGESKEIKAERVKAAQAATASMGKFDTRAKGEKAPAPRGKTLAVAPVEISAREERTKQMKLLRSVLGGTGEGERERARELAREARVAGGKRGREEADDSHTHEGGRKIRKGKAMKAANAAKAAAGAGAGSKQNKGKTKGKRGKK